MLATGAAPMHTASMHQSALPWLCHGSSMLSMAWQVLWLGRQMPTCGVACIQLPHAPWHPAYPLLLRLMVTSLEARGSSLGSTPTTPRVT
jgi:hypothetical protein